MVTHPPRPRCYPPTAAATCIPPERACGPHRCPPQQQGRSSPTRRRPPTVAAQDVCPIGLPANPMSESCATGSATAEGWKRDPKGVDPRPGSGSAPVCSVTTHLPVTIPVGSEATDLRSRHRIAGNEEEQGEWGCAETRRTTRSRVCQGRFKTARFQRSRRVLPSRLLADGRGLRFLQSSHGTI